MSFYMLSLFSVAWFFTAFLHDYMDSVFWFLLHVFSQLRHFCQITFSLHFFHGLCHFYSVLLLIGTNPRMCLARMPGFGGVRRIFLDFLWQFGRMEYVFQFLSCRLNTWDFYWGVISIVFDFHRGLGNSPNTSLPNTSD